MLEAISELLILIAAFEIRWYLGRWGVFPQTQSMLVLWVFGIVVIAVAIRYAGREWYR